MSGSSVPGMQQGMAGGLQGGMNVPGGPQVAQSEIGTFNHLLATNPDVIHPPEHVVRQGQYFSALAAQQGVGPNGLPMNMMNAQMAGGMNPAVQQQLLRQQVARQQAAARAGQPGAPAGANPSGNHSVWQSEADIPLRRRMIAKIVTLLQNRKPNAPKEWIVKLPDMARRLEDSMYRTASCEAEYANFDTLQKRLLDIAMAMGSKQKAPKSSSGGDRSTQNTNENVNSQNMANANLGMGTQPHPIMRQQSINALGQEFGIGMQNIDKPQTNAASQPTGDISSSLGLDFNFGAFDGSLGSNNVADARKRGSDALGRGEGNPKRGRASHPSMPTGAGSGAGYPSSTGANSSTGDDTIATMNI